VAGSVLGLVIGIFFFPPIGLLAGSFLGALLGELLNNQMQAKRSEGNSARNVNAVITALGTFIAFIVGSGAKLIIASLMIYYAVKAVF